MVYLFPRFSTFECVISPLLLVVCVGFVTGATGIARILPDAAIDSMGFRRSGFVLVLPCGFGWFLIGILCHILGRLIIRRAQVLSIFILAAMPLETALLKYFLQSIVPAGYPVIAFEEIVVKFIMFLFCFFAWLIGYRHETSKVSHCIDNVDLMNRNRKYFTAIFIGVCLASTYGWGILSFVRAL